MLKGFLPFNKMAARFQRTTNQQLIFAGALFRVRRLNVFGKQLFFFAPRMRSDQNQRGRASHQSNVVVFFVCIALSEGIRCPSPVGGR